MFHVEHHSLHERRLSRLFHVKHLASEQDFL
jgi:hypothetical protein